ncbi:MAG: MFS transporter, partial [Candidatus Dadabacteria bacterium]|nr:MFS transporter [Candidatus Dadabacteria bacterium]NIQ14336.1 MFS transporter [Candidatus Dadabacteria bacterium]
IMNNYGFNSFIIYLTLIGIIGFVFSFFLRNELIDKKLLRKIDNYSYLSCMKKREVIVSSLTLFFCGSAFVATLNFISIFALSIDIKNFHIYFISYTLSVLFIRIFFGWVPDKIGKWFITLPALFVFGLSVLLLGFVTDIKLLLLAGILFGVGHGFAYPSIYSIIIENNPIEARAKSFAISSLSFTSGGMIGSFIFGLIADYFNFRIMFFVIAMVVFITFIMFGHNYKKLSAEGIKL